MKLKSGIGLEHPDTDVNALVHKAMKSAEDSAVKEVDTAMAKMMEELLAAREQTQQLYSEADRQVLEVGLPSIPAVAHNLLPC